MQVGGKAIIYFLLIVSVFWVGKTKAQIVWDTLHLINGQVVYGELKSISLGNVKFKMEGIGETTLKMSKVKTIAASTRLYRVETITKKVFFSTLKPSDKSGYVIVGDDDGGGEIPIDYIGYLSYYSENRNLFEGNVSVGFNYTKSSDIGRINFDGQLNYIMRKVTYSLVASTILTKDKQVWYREREAARLTGTYFIDSKWKTTGILNYQLNKELGLQFRLQQGAGIGYMLVSTSRVRLSSLSGLVVNQEKSIESSSVNVTSEIPIFLNFYFFRFHKPEITFSTYQNIYFSWTEKGRIRHDGDIRLDWKVISDFNVNLRFYSNFDNRPLTVTSSTFDYGLVFGIGFKWD
jgi:hypothetical protein